MSAVVVRIRSRLEATALMLRIQEGIDVPHPTLWSLSGLAGRKPMLGSVGEGRILLFRRRYGSLTPFFYGEVRPVQGGSEVAGTLTFHPFLKLLVGLLVGSGVVGGAVCVGYGLPLSAGAAPVGCAAAGFATLWLGRRFARADGPFIERYLQACAAEGSDP